ncbi:MAG: ATP-binding protein [Trueperaceae bacterium]|nr:MAG: ATP-binding protein [Trueperaceae bacterium]
MNANPTIGMVLGTEDATPLQFWFAVSAGCKVQLDDIVFVEVGDPSNQDQGVRFYGVVDEVRRRFEGVQFDGDTELVVDGLLPADVAYGAHVLVTRVDPEEFIPPAPGDRVYEAHGDALEKALYLDHMESPLPAGVLRNGEPGFINFDFINGQKGAHVNISGISGIATKTSYALFLLYSLFNAKLQEGLLRMGSSATKAVIFNLKGEDLLFIDQPNSVFSQEEQRWQQRHRVNTSRYSICGLPETPFESCEMYAPARDARRGEALMADVIQREGVRPYLWTVHAFANERMLPFVLADREAMTNLAFLVGHVEEKLVQLAAKQAGPHLEVDAFRHHLESASADEEDREWSPLNAEEFLNSKRTDRDRLETFDDLVSYLEYKLLYQVGRDGSPSGDPTWVASQAKATREAFIRRLRGASKYLRRLVRGDLNQDLLKRAVLDILGSDKQVHVVDLHQLAPLAQMFTVGVLLKRIFDQKEAGRKGQVFIVLDELNKYAPSEGESPIKDVLLDIAERGRSMGVILIGAQQTASEVERRIVANAAIRVVGRLDAAEAERGEYRFMPGSFRMRSTILAPGTMIVHQPDVPSPMMLTFPFPAWATRKKEAAESVSDSEAQDILG